jgi:hypothetical protein
VGSAQTRGSHDWAQASTDSDDAHGDRGGVSQAPHQPAASRPHGLSLSAAPSGDHAPESRLGSGYHLYFDEARLRVCVRRPGLGESPGVGAIICLSSGFGRISNTRRCICTPTRPSALRTRDWSTT